jgi:hypothetical protein
MERKSRQQRTREPVDHILAELDRALFDIRDTCFWCNDPAIPESYQGKYCVMHRQGPRTRGLVRP